MKTTFLLLGLSLCLLLLSNFHEVSCQDDGSGLSHLDLMERDYQENLQGKNDEDQSAKIQNENQKNNTVTDKNTISLSMSDDSTQVGSVREESFKSSSLADQIELEFEAHFNSLNQVGSNGDKADSKYDEELSTKRKSMLEAVEREFEAAMQGIEVADSTGSKDDEEQSAAKRLSMLEEIEREFEAATKGVEQLKVRDSTGDNIEQEEAAKRQSMLDEIEREFQDSLKQFQVEDNEHSAKRQSMLEEIEREFEGVGGLKRIKIEDSITVEDEPAKRTIVLEEIEREYEEHSGVGTKTQSGSAVPNVPGLAVAQSGVCGCFKEDNAGLSQDEIGIAEILSEESKIEETDTNSMSASLIQLFESHRKEKESPLGSHRLLISSARRESSSVTSETVETLRAKLKELRGLTARELVTHKDFDKILITGASFEELSSAPISYISRLAKYRNVIKEGLEASERVHSAQIRATMLKEVAIEKQTAVDTHFASAKALAQEGDALYVRILAVKKLLAKLEAEKESFQRKFEETTKELSHLLVDASEAYEEYHGAVRKAKAEKAAEEFAKEATESAEIIWVKFLSSL